MNKKNKVIDELKSVIKTAIVDELSVELNIDKPQAEKIADKLVPQIIYAMEDEGGFSVKKDGIEAYPIEDNLE